MKRFAVLLLVWVSFSMGVTGKKKEQRDVRHSIVTQILNFKKEHKKCSKQDVFNRFLYRHLDAAIDFMSKEKPYHACDLLYDFLYDYYTPGIAIKSFMQQSRVHKIDMSSCQTIVDSLKKLQQPALAYLMETLFAKTTMGEPSPRVSPAHRVRGIALDDKRYDDRVRFWCYHDDAHSTPPAVVKPRVKRIKTDSKAAPISLLSGTENSSQQKWRLPEDISEAPGTESNRQESVLLLLGALFQERSADQQELQLSPVSEEYDDANSLLIGGYDASLLPTLQYNQC